MPHSYENYDDKASTYTALRRPMGAEKVAKFISQRPRGSSDPIDLSTINLFDSGCGTGNYTVEFLNKYNLKSVHLSDYSEAMVNEAKKNVEKALGQKIPEEASEPKAKVAKLGSITFSTDNVCDMTDIPDAHFDAVINNQVVHHLRPDAGPLGPFTDLQLACKEWYRVLKPGGRLAVNFAQPINQRLGSWWAELIPKAHGQWEQKAPPATVFKSALIKAGFKEEDVVFEPEYDEILYDRDMYFDYQGFVKNHELFMRSDSTFNLATEEEKKAAVEKVKKMIDDGTAEEWFRKKEWERKQVGQTMFVWARK